MENDKRFKRAFAWFFISVIGYICTVGFFSYLYWSPLSDFIIRKFPDLASEGFTYLNLIEHFLLPGLVYFIGFSITIIVSIYLKRVAFLGIGLLLFNFTFFVAVRYKYEFYIWMIRGPQDNYGSLGTGVFFMLIGFLSVIWLIVELKSYFSNRSGLIYKTFTFIGILVSVLVSIKHFLPVLSSVLL